MQPGLSKCPIGCQCVAVRIDRHPDKYVEAFKFAESANHVFLVPVAESGIGQRPDRPIRAPAEHPVEQRQGAHPVVWIDPPPTDYVGLAFEDLHAALEHSWIKASNLERRVVALTTKNKKLKKKNELMETMCFVIVLGISIVASLVSVWSN